MVTFNSTKTEPPARWGPVPAQAHAAHDFENAYADLRLALTAQPTFIFVDDCDDENGAKPAIEQFLVQYLENRVDYIVHISYVGGGLVIKLKDGPVEAEWEQNLRLK